MNEDKYIKCVDKNDMEATALVQSGELDKIEEN
nr:MAG TPA: hypothetical protein [Caudoviricetes sp.]